MMMLDEGIYDKLVVATLTLGSQPRQRGYKVAG